MERFSHFATTKIRVIYKFPLLKNKTKNQNTGLKLVSLGPGSQTGNLIASNCNVNLPLEHCLNWAVCNYSTSVKESATWALCRLPKKDEVICIRPPTFTCKGKPSCLTQSFSLANNLPAPPSYKTQNQTSILYVSSECPLYFTERMLTDASHLVKPIRSLK